MQEIKTTQLVKQYKNLTAVDKLGLEIQQGELFSLLGVNGAGKTTLLAETLKRLAALNIPAAVIVGDQYGSIDACRMRVTGAPVTQIETRSSCHLDASRIQEVLEEAIPEETEILFIENVGNLVCPAEFDTGAHMKTVILSVPEGDDKPLKYPLMYQTCDLLVINKVDVEPYFDFDRAKLEEYARRRNPEIDIIYISAKTGEGIGQLADYLLSRAEAWNN